MNIERKYGNISIVFDTLMISIIYSFSVLVYYNNYFYLRYQIPSITNYLDVNELVLKFSLRYSMVIIFGFSIAYTISLVIKKYYKKILLRKKTAILILLLLLIVICVINYFTILVPFAIKSIMQKSGKLNRIPIYTYLYIIMFSMMIFIFFSYIINDKDNYTHFLKIVTIGIMLFTSMLILSHENNGSYDIIDSGVSIIQYNDMHKEKIRLLKNKENYVIVIQNMKITCINRNQFISITQDK